jgi:cytochrome oxidase assembly protein ShyY1
MTKCARLFFRQGRFRPVGFQPTHKTNKHQQTEKAIRASVDCTCALQQNKHTSLKQTNKQTNNRTNKTKQMQKTSTAAQIFNKQTRKSETHKQTNKNTTNKQNKT